MSMRKFATLLVALVAFFGTLSAQLPSAQLKNINGETVNTAEISNDGKPIIISFFATWCKPCIRELKAIHELYPDWQEETGVRIILSALIRHRMCSRSSRLLTVLAGNTRCCSIRIASSSVR